MDIFDHTPVVAYKRYKKHEYKLDNIPEGMATEQIHHRLEGESPVCPNCGETMTEIGTEIVCALEINPARQRCYLFQGVPGGIQWLSPYGRLYRIPQPAGKYYFGWVLGASAEKV